MYEFIDDLLGIGERIVTLTTKLTLGSQTHQRLVLFCLHARIVDLGSAALALVRSHDVAGVPHLVRGQFEAYADLRNLAMDSSYVENMEASYRKEVERVLRNGALAGLGGGAPEFLSAQKAAKDRLDELEAKGAPALNVSERFRKAGMITEYYSVYAYLCSHSHNNLNALEAQHIDKTATPHQLVIGLDSIDAELAMLIEASVKVPLLSLDVLMQGTVGSLANEYAAVRSDFEAAQRGWAHLLVPSP